MAIVTLPPCYRCHKQPCECTDGMTLDNSPLVVSYGGGVNSTAMLIGMQQRGIRPDLILFADTGGEFDATYRYVARFSDWLRERDFPPITETRYDSKHGTLEQECHNNHTLPSLAFGFRGCSVKWKRQPMDKHIAAWEPAQAAWEAGRRVQRALGIDAGEQHRGLIPSCNKYEYSRPLVEWVWNRDKCLQVIGDAGLCPPRRSACFFCPASPKREVITLAHDHPDLFERAVAMERHAFGAGKLTVVRGLGRHWSWEELVKADSQQMKMFDDSVDEPCECFDG